MCCAAHTLSRRTIHEDGDRQVLRVRAKSPALPISHVPLTASRRPIRIAMVWWASCFAIYAVGFPIDYSRHNFYWVTALLAGSVLFALLGYRLGTGTELVVLGPATWKLPIPVIVGFIASLVLVVPMSDAYAGISVFDVGKALSNQASAYSLAAAQAAQGFDSRSGIVVAQAVLAPFTLGVIPFLALAWFEARKHGLLLLMAVLAPAVLSIVTGRTQQIGTTAVVILGALVLSLVRRGRKLRWFQIVGMVLLAFVLTIAFGAQKLARIAGYPLCVPGESVCRAPGIDLLQGAWLEIASYSSQGFEGLGHALDATWTFGGGLSHSAALESMLASFLQFEPPPVVTSQLNMLGWSSTGYWSTGLASIANDVPWVLVPLAVGFQAVILGFSWRSAVRDGDWISSAVFCYTWLSILFIPQNLQIAVSGPTYVGYLILLLVYAGRSVHRQLNRSRRSSLTRGTDLAA